MDAVASSDGFLKPTAARVVIGRRWAAMEGENCEDGVIFKGQRTEAEGLDRSRDIRIVSRRNFNTRKVEGTEWGTQSTQEY